VTAPPLPCQWDGEAFRPLPRFARVCSVEGCERSAGRIGICRMHRERIQRHGDPHRLLKRLSPRGAVMEWIDQHTGTESDECLIWPFARSPDGRAHMHGGRPSRLMCERANGPAPSSTHQAAHSCGRAHLGCVNPRHLRWATAQENAEDKTVHGTVIKGAKHVLSKLTEADVLRIRSLQGEMRQRDIASMLGVSLTTVNMVIHRKSWRHVP
jgi:predicted DNA-binding protein (UPF0251 family)